jgi:hypothetical protein
VSRGANVPKIFWERRSTSLASCRMAQINRRRGLQRNNEVSATRRGMAVKNVAGPRGNRAGPRGNRGNSNPAPRRSSGYGELSKQFFAVPIKSRTSRKRRGRPRTKPSIFRKAAVAVFRRWQFPSVDVARLQHRATHWLTGAPGREHAWFPGRYLNGATTQNSSLQGVEPANVIRP